MEVQQRILRVITEKNHITKRDLVRHCMSRDTTTSQIRAALDQMIEDGTVIEVLDIDNNRAVYARGDIE